MIHIRRYTTALFAILLLASASPAGLSAQIVRPGDENWDGRFGMLAGGGGVDDEVFAVAVDKGMLYVGGTFQNAVNMHAGHVARWDGNSWLRLGDSATGYGTDGPVFAIAVKGDSVIVAGQFTKAGDVPASNIAIWRRSSNTWFAIESGVGGGDRPYISSLAVKGDSIIVGGQFTSAGGRTANNVAYWNGTSWNSIGSGQRNGIGGTVNAVAYHGGAIYAGGNFSTAGGVQAQGVAMWNGLGWGPVGTGVDGYVNAIAFHLDGTMIVGGSFLTVGGEPAENIAYWNGTKWESLPGVQDATNSDTASGAAGVIRSMITIGERLLVTGTFATVKPGGSSNASINVNYIAFYDGLNGGNYWWIDLKRGANGYVNAVCTDGQSVYAGGAFTVTGGVPASHVARYDYRNWYPLGTVIDNYVRGIAIAGGNIYVGWNNQIPGGEMRGRLAYWNNSQWVRLSELDGELFSMISVGDDIIAGGSFATAGKSVAVNVARMSTATREWRAINKGSGVAGGDVSSVQAIAVHEEYVYLGGQFTIADTIGSYNITRFNTTTGRWDSLGRGLSGPVRAMTVTPDGEVFAGGDFTFSGSDTIHRVARWDGSQWHPLGLGADATVTAMTSSGDKVYIGGDFDSVDGRPMNHVAVWDRTEGTWSSLGNGIRGSFLPSVSSMIVVGRNLYVAGYFEMAGDDSAFCIARWDGHQWNPMGSGVNNTTLALVNQGLDVYVGGAFTTAGADMSLYVGLWHEPVTSVDMDARAGERLGLRGAPNPFSTAADIRMTNPERGEVSVRIFDLQGREVATLADGVHEAGDLSFRWDAESLPAGVYICRARCGDRVAVRSLVLAR